MAQHTIDLPCIADTWVDRVNPTTNYGSATSLKGGSDNQAESYIVLGFNTNLYPARKKLISANLLIYNLEYRKTSQSWASMWCYFPTIAWGEYTLNWNNSVALRTPNGYYRDTISFAVLPQNTYITIDFSQLKNVETGETFVPGLSKIANILLQWDDPGISATYPGVNDNMIIASRETTNPPKLRIVYEDIPPDAPTPIDPIGTYKDRSSIIRFAWQYNSPAGGAQNKFDLMWSTNGTSWTTISQATANNYYDMPVNTLPTGPIQWKVKTYNEYGEYAESPVNVFTCIGAPPTPIITGVTNASKPTVTWSSTSQQVYQVQMLQGSNIVYDTGSVPSISVKSHTVTIFMDDGTYMVKVRVKNEYDLFSDWASAQFTISTPKPVKPPITLHNCKHSVSAISDLAGNSYLLLFRKEATDYGFKCIAKSTKNIIEDYTVESNKQYQYFVRAVSSTGTYIDSDIKSIISAIFNMSVLSPVTDLANIFEIRHNLKERPVKTINISTFSTTNYYTGREYPTVEYSEHLGCVITLTFFTKDNSKYQQLLEILRLKTIVLYRDGKRKLYGNISGINVTDHFAGYVVNLSINQTDYNEYLEV